MDDSGKGALNILDNGIQLIEGRFNYLWFRLGTPQGNLYRVLTLRELVQLPRPLSETGERENFNFLRRQVAAMRGLHNAGVDFVYTAAGIFRPHHVGIVQLYGATAEGPSLQEAVRLALERQAAVDGIMANHIQSRLAPPNPDWVRWMMDFMAQAGQVLLLLGHPDPRDAPKGLDDNRLDPDDLAAEQNEALFRALAALRKNFVFQVTSRQVPRPLLSQHLVDVSRQVSQVASRQRGTKSIGVTLSIPLMTALQQAHSGGYSTTHATAHSRADGVSQGWNIGEAHGHAHTEGVTTTTGGSVSHSVSHGVTHSTADTQSHTVSQSTTISDSVTSGSSHTVSHSVTNASGVGTSLNNGWYSGQSVGSNHGGSLSATDSSSTSTGVTSSHSVSEGSVEGSNVNAGLNFFGLGKVGGGLNSSTSLTTTSASASSASTTTGHAQTNTSSWSVSHNTNWGASGSVAHSSFSSQAETTGTADSTFQSRSHGVAHTRGEAWGTARTTGRAESRTQGTTLSSFWSTSRSVSDTVSETHSQGQSWGRSHVEGDTVGRTQGQTLGKAWGVGLSTGLLPGVSLGRSWQTEDDVAIRLTQLMRQLVGLLDRASAEGAWLTHVALFLEDHAAAKTAAAAVAQAFHGPDVPTPVFTTPPDPQDEPLVRTHGLAFRPWEDPEGPGRDPFSGILWTKYSTLLVPDQLAALTSPGVFAEGTVKLVEPIPRNKIMFYPAMEGDVVLGHQFSPETGQLTQAPVRFQPWAFMHFLFAANSGYGKSVGAERLVYELGKKLGFQIVVLDFGFGWRKLLNAPGMDGLVDVRQLSPFSPRALRWNPLRISRYIPPTQFLKGFIDTWDQLTQMGQKQQRIWFETLIREMYLDAGALTDDPDVWNHPRWGKVRAGEDALIGEPVGTALRDLFNHGEYDKLQILAVHRSTNNPQLSLKALYDRIEEAKEKFGPRDRIMQDILSGLMVRLRPLVVGAPALQFAPGRDAVDLPDLLSDQRIVILEGKGLDKRAAGFLLGWAGWIFYYDRVNRRQRQMDTAPMFMFYEEANVVFSGLSASGNREDNVQSLAESYDIMVRDSRKYKIFFGFAVQNPSLLPQGVLHSCPNVLIGHITDPEDKKQVLSLLGYTEVGFQDNEMRRLLSDLSVAMMLGRFAYDFDRRETQTFLFRPLLLDVPEPNDDELAEKLGRITL
ncbi:MAG TPA: ATP-binding protein [Anaerolineae bacterium]|nr:ATP-binding protein [Anaerolineae bacterium]